jgi:molybdopterin converting factor small subunit
VKGFNENPMRPKWRGLPENQPPEAPNTHSILVDPRDANHLYVGLSAGGFFESPDGGASWTPMNDGIERQLPPGVDAEFAQDPHCVRAWVEAEGATLGALLDALESAYPGLRFRVIDEQDRVRSTILMVVDGTVVRDLTHPLAGAWEVRIVAALSGG